MINLAIFASGSGTNAEKIMERFAADLEIQVGLVLTNNPKAFVLERAKKFNVPTRTFDKVEFVAPSFASVLDEFQVDYIILAGFLWKMPKHLIDSFPDRILNIHPALLPKFGGKGMYGSHVHKAVIEAGEAESGITIHLVNEHYDQGRILFQKSFSLTNEESANSLAEKIHILEHEHYPKVIREFVLSSI